MYRCCVSKTDGSAQPKCVDSVVLFVIESVPHQQAIRVGTGEIPAEILQQPDRPHFRGIGGQE